MTATSTPFGLQPLKHPSGVIRPDMLRLTKALAEATPTLYQNQPVQLDTSGRLAAAANGSSFVGTFQGVEYTDLASGRPVVSNQWLTGTTVKDYGADSARFYFTQDPEIWYRIQASGALTAAAVGDQLDFLNPTTGQAVTGLSQAQADSSTLKGAGVQGMMRIYELSYDPDNLDWTDLFPIIVVGIARHQFIADKTAI